MKYKILIKETVRQLRTSGVSLNKISQTTKVPKSTVRLWIKDIKLSEEQKEILERKVSRALQEGREKAQTINKQRRQQKETSLLTKGKEEIGKLTKKELLIAGIALYWAEGFKNRHEKRLGFCNSDPEMILFYLKWLEAVGISKKDLTARLSLNIAYKESEQEIRNYWSKLIRIPLNQFTKTFFQNSRWKKEYSDNAYHGVLRIHVQESLNQLLLMRGWIEGLKSNVRH